MAENERLRIFNKKYEPIGTAQRNEVHSKGLWHETFHCWFYSIEQEDVTIYFQKRSMEKKDFPGQLDITAAGHLLEEERVIDGFREVKEELGIDVPIDSAESLGVFIVEIDLEDFFDHEFTNVFLVRKTLEEGSFLLQEEEVEGLFPVRLQQLKEIFYERTETLTLKGVCQRNGKQYSDRQTFRKEDFCANAYTYYERLIDSFEKILEKERKTLD
ncbi:NUDIX domain-containing protein [Enterococcus sp. BWM-S5]|uniref:NUDIX domain-containing protein n=1 Tax=Enterococcus larvae TaxID=2794352 RepID=A0ABS4CGB8_9ENTE|nr:NUDIX domain-containing protein [Enterococcus larvae]MBP1045602.1 NUDIX domain-containing protein [Enterococcus larvae]